MNVAVIAYLIGAVMAGRESPAPAPAPQPPVQVTITAVYATHEARGHQEFEPGLEPVKRALSELGYDTFHKVCASTISAPFEAEQSYAINPKYTLGIQPLSRERAGCVRMHYRVTMASSRGGEPITALATTVAMHPGKQFMLRGLKLDKGELILIITIQ